MVPLVETATHKLLIALELPLSISWLFVTKRERKKTPELKSASVVQVRLRANLKEMPSTAAAYKRYLEKFDKQETQIEKYQADIKKLQGQEHEKRKEFEAFLAQLNVE